MCVWCMLSRVQLFATPWTVYSPPGSSVHKIISAKYWSGCNFLLQGIIPIQGSNLCLLQHLH